MAERFDHKKIEKAAQEKWEALGLYRTDLSDTSKDPYYLLFEFPYPSGDLHTGHWYAYAITDIFARFKRMRGFNVLFPIGFDAFGLPAENAALKNGADPKVWTLANIERMKTQIRSMGTSVDWSKEIVTCEPAYYRWTQWLFSKLFEHGLAEHKEAAVKWCPKDQTVLANEQVIDGRCERCGTEVVEKVLTQWFLGITKYAERLLSDLDALPWREDIKDAQRAWIGKSEGAKIDFVLKFKDQTANEWRGEDGKPAHFTVFTTRPDTIFGATYAVLAPEHPWIAAALARGGVLTNEKEVRAYVEQTVRKTERERSENKKKTGIELKGVRALNPATKEEIPVFAADYVLASYGTGAVMAVPAHDERDFEFAQVMKLPVTQVIIPRVVDTRNPPQEGKEDTFRRIILAIVHDPKTDRYLTLKWKEHPWTTFVTGGIEEGEDPIEAARREIAEETGYTEVKPVRLLGGLTQSEFYAAHKGVNRRVHNQPVLFELTSDARSEVADDEKRHYDIAWMTADEVVAAKLQHAEFDILWQRVRSGLDAYTGDGILIHSGEFDERENRVAMSDIVAAIGGARTTNYRLRDWLVSRQRYWGCPIPVVYDPQGKPHLVPAEHLPWLLPTDVDFKSNGSASPLASSKELKERVARIFGEGWTPEYDTLDTFIDSSWYFLRYLDPNDEHDFSDASLMKKWMPVDRYSGGSEHTTMHLLYARFFVKALYDLALVPVAEPFLERFNRGLILGPDGQKMSKSKGNVLNPDEFVEKYGSDALRAYLAFIGPYNEPGNYPWNLDGVVSMRKFLDRVAAAGARCTDAEASDELMRALARAGEKVAADSERFKFNTAISALMVCLKDFEALDAVPRAAWHDFLKLLAPFAPHLAEHLWHAAGGEGSVHAAAWPIYDSALLEQSAAAVVVQVNGKRRGELQLATDAPETDALAAARALPAVASAMASAEPKRVVYVPGRILNIVI